MPLPVSGFGPNPRLKAIGAESGCSASPVAAVQAQLPRRVDAWMEYEPVMFTWPKPDTVPATLLTVRRLGAADVRFASFQCAADVPWYSSSDLVADEVWPALTTL